MAADALINRAFYALLRLVCCSHMIFALAQDKDVFGHKVIQAITIFRPQCGDSRTTGYYDMSECPAVLLEIVPFNGNTVKEAQREESRYYDPVKDTYGELCDCMPAS
jgi:hypothetical protein